MTNRDDAVLSETVRIRVSPRPAGMGPTRDMPKAASVPSGRAAAPPPPILEADLQELFQSVYDAGIISDLTGTILDVNVRAVEFFGRTREELVGMRLPSLISGASASLPGLLLSQLQENRFVLIQAHCLSSGGQTFPAEIAVNRPRLSGCDYLCLFVRNTSARESAEQALRESEERFRSLIESMNEGFTVIDSARRFTYVNQRFSEMLGFGPDDFIGHWCSEFLDAENQATLEREFARREQGHEDRYELAWTRRDGVRLATIVSPRPSFSAEGHFTGASATITDVGELKRVKGALRRGEERLRKQNAALSRLVTHRSSGATDFAAAAKAVTETASGTLEVERVSIWLFDEVGVRIRCVDLYERTPDRHSAGVELVAEESPSYIKALSEERVLAAHDAHDDPRTAELSSSYLSPPGITSVLAAPIRLDGKCAGMVCHEHVGPAREWALDEQAFAGALADVLSVMLEAQELRRVERERRELGAQLRHKQKLESIGTLAGGVAHEINNPINGIMNYAQLIKDQLPDDGKTADFATEIIHESERVATVIRSLLAFSRRDPYTLRPTQIKDVLDRVLLLLNTPIRRSNIERFVAIDEDLPPVLCHSQQIQQVLVNLLTNAIDALDARYPKHHPNKLIRITAQEEKGGKARRVAITVEDHGVGIRDGIRGRLFDPFFTTKSRTQHTGLGLAISHSIVQDHGGDLHVTCEQGRWTRFRVVLLASADGGFAGPAHAPAALTQERVPTCPPLVREGRGN